VAEVEPSVTPYSALTLPALLMLLLVPYCFCFMLLVCKLMDVAEVAEVAKVESAVTP
jgi:hypothetical protein